jgi:hypothetical protein
MESSPPAILTILTFVFLPQVYQTNQAPPLAYDQSYHYTTTNHPQCPPAPQITYPPPVPQITYPPQARQITYQGKTITLKSKMKPIHHHNLRHKIKNLSNKVKLSQLMTQSLQLPVIPTSISTPSSSAETITEK